MSTVPATPAQEKAAGVIWGQFELKDAVELYANYENEAVAAALAGTCDRPGRATDKACKEHDQLKAKEEPLRCFEGDRGRTTSESSQAVGYRPGLTQDEKQVLERLAEAWNAFLSLNDGRADSTDDFRRAVHAAQRVIAARVARRINPEIWNG